MRQTLRSSRGVISSSPPSVHLLDTRILCFRRILMRYSKIYYIGLQKQVRQSICTDVVGPRFATLSIKLSNQIMSTSSHRFTPFIYKAFCKINWSTRLPTHCYKFYDLANKINHSAYHRAFQIFPHKLVTAAQREEYSINQKNCIN